MKQWATRLLDTFPSDYIGNIEVITSKVIKNEEINTKVKHLDKEKRDEIINQVNKYIRGEVQKWMNEQISKLST